MVAMATIFQGDATRFDSQKYFFRKIQKITFLVVYYDAVRSSAPRNFNFGQLAPRLLKGRTTPLYGHSSIEHVQ